MGRLRVNRTAAIIVASAALHLLLLSALAIEATRSGPRQTAEPPAIQVTLAPPLQPPAERKPRAKTRKAASAPAPQRPASAVQAAPPIAQSAPRVDAGEATTIGDVVRALRGSVGCSNPDAVDLTPAERDACRRRFHAGLEDAKPMLGLTAEKRARFDHASQCNEAWRIYRASPGAPMPRLRDCPASDQ